jgi:ABC-type transport system involved in multi-copper enzyme maturation permease subunit
MKFLAIIEGTIREGLAKKTILGMFIVSTVGIILAIFIFQMDSVQHGLLSPATSHIHSGQNAPPPTAMLGVTVLDFVWMIISSFLLLLSVFVGSFVTTGFITSLMEKGSIDLLLSKPVPRWVYITGRYTGAVLIILVEVAYLVFGLWLTAGLSLGSWSPTFLSSIFFITLTFAGIYALITLIGVLTRSSWFAIIIGLALSIVASIVVPIGEFLDRLLNGTESTGVLTVIAKIFHYTIPSQGMGATLTKVLTGQPADYTPVFLTFGLALAYLALSCYAFSRKEF